jgi:thiol-disulfide isomerase/thioredoxin
MPTTDAEGRWTINNVPDHPEVELHLLITHPDYVADERWNAKTAGVTTKMFREGTATMTLKSGVIVRGRVTDPSGKPIKDAIVIHGDDPYMGQNTSTFATDAEGRFRLPALPTGPRSLTVMAPGFAPQMRKVELKRDLPDQDFQLALGKPVRLRITTAAGNSVPKPYVTLVEWKGSKSIDSNHNPNHPKVPDTGIPRRADAEGVWDWPSPPDEPVKVRIFANGFAPLELDVTGGSTDRTVTLKAEHRITGAVTDALTGKPIPAFTVIPVDVFGKDFLHAERFNAARGKDGRLEFLADRADIPLRLRIEARGYRTQDGPEFRVGDGNRKQDFRLQPSPPRTGRVVDAAGKPVPKAPVMLATPTEAARGADHDTHRTFTDAAGRFEFPDPGEPWAVVVRADAGYAAAEFPADKTDAGTLTLRPWGSVRGKFQDGGKPVAGATVFLNPVRLDNPDRPRIDATLQVRTDAGGRFEFPRVPPGPVRIHVSLGPWRDEGFRSGPSVPLDLKPGEKSELHLGSGGATLTGKAKLTGKVPADLDCTYSLNYLVRRESGITPPAEVAAAGFDITKGWRDSWHNSFEGLAYMSTLRSWFVKLAADGNFRISGVPPGEYDLAIAVYAKPSGCLTDPLARQLVRVTVTAADVTRGELKVPEIAAEVVPIPELGDIPSLTFKGADSKEGTLAAFRGKHTVVHFWASWCVPCKKQLPALKKLHEQFSGRGLVTISLSLDDNANDWTAAVKGLDLPWAQGRLGGSGTAGVSSVPTYWILDPAGKIVAKVADPDDIVKELEKRLK